MPLPQPDPGIIVSLSQGSGAYFEDLLEGIIADVPVVQQLIKFPQGAFDGRARDGGPVGPNGTVECTNFDLAVFGCSVDDIRGCGRAVRARRTFDGPRRRRRPAGTVSRDEENVKE